MYIKGNKQNSTSNNEKLIVAKEIKEILPYALRDDFIGVTNRAASLKRNEDMRDMLAAPIDYSTNFIDLISKGKTVLVRIPQTIVHQIPTCAKFLTDYLTEFRRHRLSFLFAIHYLKQFRELLDAVRNAGTSYMILAGCGKDNVNML